MEDAVGSSLFKTVGGGVHSLSGGGESADGQQLYLLRVSDTGASVNNLLSRVLEVLRKLTKLLYFSFDEGIAKLLDGAVNDELIGLSQFEDPLTERVERGLCAVARPCAKFDREHGVSFTHGEMGAGANVVEYEVYVFGLALVVIRIVDGRGDAESSVGPILDERWSRMSIAGGIVDDGRSAPIITTGGVGDRIQCASGGGEVT